MRRALQWGANVIAGFVLLVLLVFGTAGPRHWLALTLPSSLSTPISLPKPVRVHDFPLDLYSYAFGQCTWYAQWRVPDEPLLGLGDPKDWAARAEVVGLPVGPAPRVGSTVVFPAYFDENSDVDGHVAHVEAVYPDGSFLVSEMNTFGGGWGIVSWRVILPDSSLRFIY